MIMIIVIIIIISLLLLSERFCIRIGGGVNYFLPGELWRSKSPDFPYPCQPMQSSCHPGFSGFWTLLHGELWRSKSPDFHCPCQPVEPTHPLAFSSFTDFQNWQLWPLWLCGRSTGGQPDEQAWQGRGAEHDPSWCESRLRLQGQRDHRWGHRLHHCQGRAKGRVMCSMFRKVGLHGYCIRMPSGESDCEIF